ncbi:hypothetical protein T4D_11495 [Trichinella pseudospiralis]|uniref:Uncharacterized protein n=1 Tax=Trichinella pseudospiralis TaxID=6337 RepID=A0A0V1FAS5_TRIPS|nr:hypothetical protein T4D_11495 [Trichinella pseudospiralis]
MSKCICRIFYYRCSWLVVCSRMIDAVVVIYNKFDELHMPSWYGLFLFSDRGDEWAGLEVKLFPIALLAVIN